MTRKTEDIPFLELTPEEQELDPRARFGWSGAHQVRPLRADGTPATEEERDAINEYLNTVGDDTGESDETPHVGVAGGGSVPAQYDDENASYSDDELDRAFDPSLRSDK